MSVDTLLAEVTNAPPCGPNLEYDPEFVALEQAARGKPEQQLGETIVPAEEPDWADVAQRAQALLARTKDLRVAVLYARARIRTDHLAGLADGLVLVKELLTRYGEYVHPALDADDGNDPIVRVNALAPLNDPDTFLRDVRGAFLVTPAAYGRVAVRDILLLLGKLPAGEAAPNQAEVEGVIRAAAAANGVQADAARAALRAATELRTLLAEQTNGAPDLKPLTDMLRPVVQICDALLGVPEGTAPEAGDAIPGLTLARDGEIHSREDAAHALDRVCEFFRRTEPSNPAPLFIRRAQQLMTKSFVEIIQDLAPDSLTQIQKITGEGNR